jgi:hypothetical protein
MAERHAISLREAREANFWSRLLATDPAYRVKVAPIVSETGEFVAMLTASVKKLRQPVTSSPPASDF